MKTDNDLKDQKQASEKVEYWLKEIASARKREKNFRKEGEEITAIYEGKKPDKTQYNVLYSNTDTLAPALYNTTPRPVVQRRFKDEDKLAGAASQVTQRTLEFLVDNGEQEYSTFDDLMRAAVLEALVPGRGVTCFEYDAVIEGEGPTEKVTYERVCGKEVPWDRFLHGYGKKWNQVPWVAFEDHMTKEELIDNFGEIAKEIEVEESETDATDSDDGSRTKNDDGETAGAKVVVVYRIWSKTDKKVYFICQAHPEAPLKVVDDPLKLTGFFPCPRPMSFVQKISTLVPVALYKMYEKQAEELNCITSRLNHLIHACRVRGMYDATVEGMVDALKAEDNVLIPINNVAAQVAQGLTLEKSIWVFPLEKVIAVIQQLYLARQQIKAVIFEITGIADIMRGSSQASETLGAQEIKNQWGTLRLKRVQKEVMRYVRDSLRIMAEIAVTKMSPDTLKKMTGLPYPTEEEKAQAQMAAQQAQQMGQQVPPQLGQVLQAPSWGEILALLKDDLTRCYKIDIETNSTVDAEATEDKQNISELLNAMAQFLNGIAPLVEQQILPFEAAQTMLLAIVRRFRFGTDVEESLKQMKAPAPQDDGKAKAEQAKMQMEQAKGAQELEMTKTAHEFDKQIKQLELQIAQEKARLEREQMLLDFKLKQAEHAMKMQQLERKSQTDQMKAGAQMAATAQQAQIGQQQHAQSLEAGNQKAELGQQAADIKAAQLKQQAKAAKEPAKEK
jgi:hypothetical protein